MQSTASRRRRRQDAGETVIIRVTRLERRGARLRMLVFLLLGLSLLAVPYASAEPARGTALDGQALGAIRSDAERRAERRRSPQARQEREQSRTRYHRLGRTESVKLAREKFAEPFKAPVLNAQAPAPGLRLVKTLNAGAAVVTDGERKLLLDSTVPLATADKKPIDLGLVEDPAGFSPTNSLVPLTIPKGTDGAVRFSRERFGLRLDAKGRSEAVFADDRVIYPEADTDSDLAVLPVPGGVEVLLQLRSADSPERFSFTVELPTGARLEKASTKGAISGDPPQSIVVMHDDKPLGYIYPPLAYDADGERVQASQRIEGDRIVLDVPHRDQDLHYPLLVDPQVIATGYYEAYNGSLWAGWSNTFTQRDYRPYASPKYNTFGAALNNPNYAPGMYISMPTNTVWLNGEYIEYRYTPPGDVHLYRARLYNWAHYPYGSVHQQGIGTPGPTAWDQPVGYVNGNNAPGGNPTSIGFGTQGAIHDYCYLKTSDYNNHDCVDGGADTNTAIFRLIVYNGGPTFGGYWNSNGNSASATMGLANVFLSDRYAPTVAASPPTPEWRDDNNQPHQLGVLSSDRGLGLQRVGITGAQSTTDLLNNGSCGDPYRFACPKNANGTINYTLPEGVSNLSLKATDIVDQTAATSWTEKVDRTAPVVVTTGDLKDWGTTAFGGDADLHIEATDGSPTAARSGVTTIEILVDGVRADYFEQTCEQSCPLSYDWTYQSSSFSSGDHTVAVVVRDALGHATTQSWRMSSDPTVTASEGDKVADDDDQAAPFMGDGITDFCSQDAEADTNYCSSDDPLNPVDVEVADEPALDPDSSTASQSYPGETLGAAPALQSGASGWGLSDQRPSTFDDPAFQALEVRQVRLIVPWEVVPRAAGDRTYSADTRVKEGRTYRYTGIKELVALRDAGTLSAVDNYMSKAAATGTRVLVSFELTKGRDRTGKYDFSGYLPPLDQYRAATDAFRSRYRARGQTVKYYTAWNEPNLGVQPTSGLVYPSITPARGARTAGRYWRSLKARCGSECTVAAGDFLDLRTLNTSERDYFDNYVAGAGSPPKLWAYHAYFGGLYENSGRFRAFLEATKRKSAGGPNSSVWMTEQGPLYHKERIGYDITRGDASLRYLLAMTRLGGGRVKRFYYYAMNGNPKPRGFDSGLRDPNARGPDGRGVLRQLPYDRYRARTNPDTSSGTP